MVLSSPMETSPITTDSFTILADAAIFPVVFIMTDFLISSFHTVFSITSPFFLLNMLLEKKKRGHQQMLSLDSTLRFIRKCVSFYLLLSPVFSLTGVLDSYLT